jgi:hypothetical protein
MDKMDKSFKSSFVGDPSDKPTNTATQVIPFDIKNGVPKTLHPKMKIASNEEKRMKRKLLHIGGMCGAVREPNDILRDIAKLCSEELE